MGGEEEGISKTLIAFIVIVVILGLAGLLFLYQSGVMEKGLASVWGPLGFFA